MSRDLIPFIESLDNDIRYCSLDGLIYCRHTKQALFKPRFRSSLDGARVWVPAVTYAWFHIYGELPERRVIYLSDDRSSLRPDNLALFESNSERFDREAAAYRNWVIESNRLSGTAKAKYILENPKPSQPQWFQA